MSNMPTPAPLIVLCVLMNASLAPLTWAQEPPSDMPASQPDRPAFPDGPGGFPGMMGREDRKVLDRFDANDDGWLNADERAEARKAMKQEAAEAPADGRGRGLRGPPGVPGGPGGGMGGRGGGPGGREPTGPGPKVAPGDVQNYPDAPMFEPTVLRTIFLDFENSDWEEELEDFHGTDVEVPCTLTVDGKTYANVGVSFRGASSYMMIPRGSKRSFNLSIDAIEKKQRLYGVRTLNLLNGNGDPSFMSTVLFSHIARQHIPAPRANHVKVVVNGESWGVFTSVEQFDKDFLQANYRESNGARWKVKGSPNGRSGLDYIGDDIEPYKQRYQIKSKDDDQDWLALIELCRVLTETPLEELEAALEPMLDIDSALWFLALDNVLVNTDGYWVRASDYSLYRDSKGKFHIVPHDMNEAFASVVGGPGGRRRGQGGAIGPGGMQPPPGEFRGPPPEGARPPGEQAPREGEALRPDGESRNPQQPAGPPRMTGNELDPLTGMNDATKPLRSRLLSVPSLRAKYIEHVQTLARESLSWGNLGPIVAQHRNLIADEIKADTRKLTSFAAFETSTADEAPPAPVEAGGRPPRSLRAFADGRSKYLLDYKPKPLGEPVAAPADAAREPGPEQGETRP